MLVPGPDRDRTRSPFPEERQVLVVDYAVPDVTGRGEPVSSTSSR
ncbi:hypothetical protein [Saccharopolyspora gregorii]